MERIESPFRYKSVNPASWIQPNPRGTYIEDKRNPGLKSFLARKLKNRGVEKVKPIKKDIYKGKRIRILVYFLTRNYNTTVKKSSKHIHL